MSHLPQWLEDKRSERIQRATDAKDRRKYGITINLKALMQPLSNWTLHGLEPSEQVVTVEHEGAQLFNLFDELENPLVKQYLLSTEPAERTMLEDVAESLADIGLLIIAPANSTSTVDLTRTVTSDHFFEYVLVIAQQGARVDIVDKITTQPGTNMRTQVVEVIAQDNAHVRFASIHADSEHTNLIVTQRAKLGKQANVEWFNANVGANKVRLTTDSYLEGKQSVAKPYGVFLATKEEQFDIAANTFHTANQSSSDMYTRGVLGGKAQAVYRGLLDIDAQAFNCDGYQTEETILISDDAIADAIPNLQIRNNEVKCSHGATIGKVDEEQLFYLTSRGMPEEQAKKMIVQGFFEPVTTKLDWPELFTYIEPLVHERIS